MKITKLLAMLLALCMILCCFAACGSSDDEDKDEDEKVEEKDDEKDEDDKSKDDEDEDDKSKDEDKDEDKDVAPKAEGIEGTWKGTIELAEIYASMGFEVDGSLELGSVFEFDDGEYTGTGVEPSEDDIEAFSEAYTEYIIEFYKESAQIEDNEELAEVAGYESFDEMYEELYTGCVDEVKMLIEGFITEENGTYEYEDGVITIAMGDTEIELEIELDGDDFVILGSNNDDVALTFAGVVFERQ